MKQRALVMTTLAILLSAGCSSSKRETGQAMAELQAKCHIYLSAEEVNIIEKHRRDHPVQNKSLFIGTYPGDPPQSRCMRDFVSSSGYRFFYTISTPIFTPH